MWPWWVKIPTEDFTDETLAIDDTHGDDVRGGDWGEWRSWTEHLWGHSGTLVSEVFGPKIPKVGKKFNFFLKNKFKKNNSKKRDWKFGFAHYRVKNLNCRRPKLICKTNTFNLASLPHQKSSHICVKNIMRGWMVGVFGLQLLFSVLK